MPEAQAEAMSSTLRAMEATEVPLTITRPDGSRDEGTVRVVHPAGDAPPSRVDHVCGPTCGRCPA